jgi:hypothetical protein
VPHSPPTDRCCLVFSDSRSGGLLDGFQSKRARLHCTRCARSRGERTGGEGHGGGRPPRVDRRETPVTNPDARRRPAVHGIVVLQFQGDAPIRRRPTTAVRTLVHRSGSAALLASTQPVARAVQAGNEAAAEPTYCLRTGRGQAPKRRINTRLNRPEHSIAARRTASLYVW